MKIQNVTINKYKAFTKEEKIPINAKNIFIYGENGSGKSSFYYALKDFFQSSVEDINMASLRNFNLNDGGTDCSIDVEFDNNLNYTLNENAKSTTITEIIDANRLKSFLTYKHLLSVHNVKITDKIDIFDLVVNGVLKHFKSDLITRGIELGVLYQNTIIESNKKFGKNTEFYYARQKRTAVERKMNLFNQALRELFEKGEPGEIKPNYIAPNVNYFLKQIYPNLNIESPPKSLSRQF